MMPVMAIWMALAGSERTTQFGSNSASSREMPVEA